MKKRFHGLFIVIFSFMIGFASFIGMPSVKAVGYYQDANTSPSSGGGGKSCDGSDPSCWRYLDGAPVFGVRLTVVDKNGTILPGTNSIDLLSSSQSLSSKFRGANLYYNKKRSYKKNASSTNWVAGVPTYYRFSGPEYSGGSPIEFKYNSITTLKRTPSNYFNKIAQQTFKSNSLEELEKTEFYKYLKKAGYDVTKYASADGNNCSVGSDGVRTCQLIYQSHYVIIEPITVITIGKAAFYGTGSELANVIREFKSSIVRNVTSVPGRLSKLLYYSGSFTPSLAYTGVNVNGMSFSSITGNIRSKPMAGYSLGVYWMGGTIPDEIVNTCDFNNPEDFYKLDADGDEVINTDTNCCTLAASQGVATQAQINERYPVCNQCKPKTTVSNAVCMENSTTTTINDDNLNCISRVGKQDKKKYIKKVNDYCYIYCREDISVNFPLSPSKTIANIGPGGTFTWPSYNINVNSATVSGSRECKIKIKTAEWQFDYDNGIKKASTLVSQMDKCVKEGTLSSYEYTLSPQMILTYNPGGGNSNLTFTLKQKEVKANTSSKENWSTTGTFTGANLATFVQKAENRLLKSTVTYQYVLPDNLNQYYSKLTGESINIDPTRLDLVDKQKSELKVSDKAKDGQYDIKIDYSNLSSTSGSETKYDSLVNTYNCKYEVKKSTIRPECDINEPSHFLDANGNGTSGDDTSGPNGENCCYVIYKQYGADSEQYASIKDLCGTPTSSCDYPNDISSQADYVTKQRCCSELAISSDPNDVTMYKQYCNEEPWCPQDCVNGNCTMSPMTQALRSCMSQGKSYDECKVDRCPGGSIVIYRPISLYANEAFPGVNKQNRIWSNNNWYYYSNWAYRGKSQKRDYYVNMYITNNREVKDYDIYKLEPMYTIELDAKTIMSIRSYNKTNSYDDFNLKCTKGRKCKSTYIRNTLGGKVTGCGVNSDWYACSGISAKRGD